MMKSGFTKRVEAWHVKNDGRDTKVTTDRIVVNKIAVRCPLGRFHGATNFPVRIK